MRCTLGRSTDGRMASLRAVATSPHRSPVTPAMVDAREAGLRWVSDATPGISRLRCERGFRYRHADGSAIDADTLRRIRRLAIPPAWRRVWICPRADGHKQAIVETVAAVARELRNTPAVCRKCYIHPLVFEAFERGVTLAAARSNGRRSGWRGIERAVVLLLGNAAQSERRRRRADRPADRKVA